MGSLASEDLSEKLTQLTLYYLCCIIVVYFSPLVAFYVHISLIALFLLRFWVGMGGWGLQDSKGTAIHSVFGEYDYFCKAGNCARAGIITSYV